MSRTDKVSPLVAVGIKDTPLTRSVTEKQSIGKQRDDREGAARVFTITTTQQQPQSVKMKLLFAPDLLGANYPLLGLLLLPQAACVSRALLAMSHCPFFVFFICLNFCRVT